MPARRDPFVYPVSLHVPQVDKQLRDTEPMLEEYLCDFLSTLLVVPDSPTQGVLSLIKALLNQISEYNWCVVVLLLLLPSPPPHLSPKHTHYFLDRLLCHS